MKNIEVLFEDNHLLAVFKPPGVLTQGDRSQDPSLMDFSKEYLSKKYKKKGNVFLGLVHRLDRPVGGVILFAKTSKSAGRLSKQFREGTIKKTYLALVEGIIDQKEGEISLRRRTYQKGENRGIINFSLFS